MVLNAAGERSLVDILTEAVTAAAGTPDARILADRPDSTVVCAGAVVAKAHTAGTDEGPLTTRLGIAAHPLLRGILLPPVRPAPVAHAGGRPVTLWPLGEPVDPELPDAAPWEAAGALAARLHQVPAAALPGLPGPMGGPAKAARAVARMRDVTPDPVVLRAWAALPAWARGEAPSPDGRGVLCHGDLHMGQLVRHPAPDGRWLLIDVDDLGTGEPSWDLARPAMWFAAGVLDPAAWTRFLGAYRAEGGPAVPRDGDPWPYLDVAARALAVQTAALAVIRARREERALDDTEQAVHDACARITEVSC